MTLSGLRAKWSQPAEVCVDVLSALPRVEVNRPRAVLLELLRPGEACEMQTGRAKRDGIKVVGHSHFECGESRVELEVVEMERWSARLPAKSPYPLLSAKTRECAISQVLVRLADKKIALAFPTVDLYWLNHIQDPVIEIRKRNSGKRLGSSPIWLLFHRVVATMVMVHRLRICPCNNHCARSVI